MLTPLLITHAAEETDQTLLATRQLTSEAAESTYALASLVMKIVDWILGIFGLGHNETLVTWLYAIVVLALSMVIGYVAKWIIIAIVERIGSHTRNDLFVYLTGARFFTKFSRIIPALTFLILIQFTLQTHTSIARLFTKITLFYVIYVVTVAINSLIHALWMHIDSRENKKRLPLNGLVQLIKGIVWIIAVIISIALLIDKSPGALLAGLGAFATVLMLIFKDSILGLVAGVQLSENDSLHVGDWIKVDGTDANGRVTEVSLTTIKVLNWDKTTTLLPPYSLISGSFTNYRSMQESNTRRIRRSYMIDADSVVPLTPQMLDEMRQIDFMDDYITKKLAQKAAGKVEDVDNPEGLVDGTIDTNLGLFRAYVRMWLKANPHIDNNSDCFVSTLDQTSTGIPFQIYCFTNTSKWFPYEAIQDTVMEHVATMLTKFRLYTFENPSGRDTIVDGYLSPGKPMDNVLGIPRPFFIDNDTPAQPKDGTADGNQAK